MRAVRARHVIAIGVAAFLAGAVYLAPAGLVGAALGDEGPARLSGIEGRLWDGRASLWFDGWPAGRLRWSFDPAGLLDARLRFDWRIQDPGYDLGGQGDVGFDGTALDATGEVGPILLERTLAPYDIAVGGALEISRLVVQASRDLVPRTVEGRLHWTGGPVGYRLAGREFRTDLPALDGRIDTVEGEPVLIVRAAGQDVPLLHVRLDHEGWAHIGITQRFTELVGMPWPGGGPADAVVLEVGEQVL
ncbi:MAG: type II secretion system protein N [Gammaproteobacteria bacterium]|nr:type II secretion system protein N [Gammaproteobacteria bacterium]